MIFTFVSARSSRSHSSRSFSLGIVLKITDPSKLYPCEEILTGIPAKDMSVAQKRTITEKMMAIYDYGKIYVMRDGTWVTDVKEMSEPIMRDELEFPEEIQEAV